MSKIPCFDQKKSSLNMLQLTQLAKDLQIDVPSKMSKRDLCVKLNSLQTAEQAKIIEAKLKLLQGGNTIDVALKTVSVETPLQPQFQKIDLPKLTPSQQMSEAIKSNDLNLVKNAFDLGMHIGSRKHPDVHELALLRTIIAFGSLEMLKFFIEKGLEIFKTDGRLVYDAVYYDKTNVLKYLLEHGVETTYANPESKVTAIFLAVKKKSDGNFRDIEILSQLINYGADINLLVEKASPLGIAVFINNYKAVKLLLENCAAVTENVFRAVQSTKNFEIGELLSKHEESKKCLKRGGPITVVEPIKFPTGDISTVDEGDVSFAGTEVNRLVAMSYFLQHYKHVCVPSIRDIEWRGATVDNCPRIHARDMPQDLIAKFQRCQQSGTVRFIVGFIGLHGAGVLGHSNAYLLDTKDTNTSGDRIVTAEIFEPHGSVGEAFYQQEKYKLALRTFFTTDLKADRLFFSDEFCPVVGLQAWQEAEKEPAKKYDPLGFCAAWTTWWIHYRLENSTIPRDNLAHQANIHFLQQRKDVSMTTFIRNYTIFIAKQRKVVVETACKNLLLNFRDYETRINRVAQLERANDRLQPLLLNKKATQSDVLQVEQNTSELQELANTRYNHNWIMDVLTQLIVHQVTDMSQ